VASGKGGQRVVGIQTVRSGQSRPDSDGRERHGVRVRVRCGRNRVTVADRWAPAIAQGGVGREGTGRWRVGPGHSNQWQGQPRLNKSEFKWFKTNSNISKLWLIRNVPSHARKN
jgi:hypothetical protein